MTPLEYRTKYNLRNVTLLSILRLYYQGAQREHITARAVRNLQKKNSYVNTHFQLPEYEPLDIIDTMVTINQMVKDKSTCPSNKRNQFYHCKHVILRYLLNSGLVERIEKQNDVLLFVFAWNGKQYSFHQPTEWYNGTSIEDKTTVIDGGVYVKNTEVNPFDDELFLRWRTTLLHHMTGHGIKLTQDNEKSRKCDKTSCPHNHTGYCSALEDVYQQQCETYITNKR